MKKMFLFFAVWLFIAQAAFTQNDTVVGILLDVNNKAIKKHPVTLGKVSSVTVKTDKKGIFVFTNANLQDTLFVGNKKGKNAIAIPLNGHDFLTIKSQKGDFNTEYSSDELEEQRRFLRLLQNDRTSSLNAIRKEDIDESQCKDIECLIERLSGVTVISNAGSQIVRIGGGPISLQGSANSALVVLNGVDMGYSLNSVSHVRPMDVENIVVSRDGSQYGVRGAAGILIVTTKNR